MKDQGWCHSVWLVYFIWYSWIYLSRITRQQDKKVWMILSHLVNCLCPHDAPHACFYFFISSCLSFVRSWHIHIAYPQHPPVCGSGGSFMWPVLALFHPHITQPAFFSSNNHMIIALKINTLKKKEWAPFVKQLRTILVRMLSCFYISHFWQWNILKQESFHGMCLSRWQ